MVTKEMIQKRIDELTAEVEEFEKGGSFGLARVKRGDIKHYQQLLAETHA